MDTSPRIRLGKIARVLNITDDPLVYARHFKEYKRGPCEEEITTKHPPPFSPTSAIPYNSRLFNLTFPLPYPFCSEAEAKYSKVTITNTVSINGFFDSQANDE